MPGEQRGERSKALVADFATDLRDRQIRAVEESAGVKQPSFGHVLVWRGAKHVLEESVKVEW